MSASADDQEDLVDVLLGLQKSGTLEYPITTNNIKGVILVSIYAIILGLSHFCCHHHIFFQLKRI